MNLKNIKNIGFYILLCNITVLIIDNTNKMTFAKVYYMASNGSDKNEGYVDSPWATFAYAIKKLQPGDTLILKDGTYYQPLVVNVSGTEISPITIKAQNDGKTIIDGQSNKRPCHVLGSVSVPVQDVIIEGIVCKNSNNDVISVFRSNRITIKRVSAYNAGTGNCMGFSVSFSSSILLEDCTASGSGRNLFNILECQNVTLRRCWGSWESHSGGGGGNNCFVLYGSDDCIIENCVGMMDPASDEVVDGVQVWANTGNDTADRNKIYGSIIYGVSGWAYSISSAVHRIEGNRFYDNVSINNANGFYQRADADLQVRNLTIVDTNNIAFALQEYSYEPKDSDYEIRGDFRNSILQSGDSGLGINDSKSPRLVYFANEYNNIYDFNTSYWGAASQGTGALSIDVGFNKTQYGMGAYLFISNELTFKTAGENGTRMGAEVLYCYHDGVLTNTPLWPWPMEERILAETGISVTWENQGGIWNTLDDVYTY
ncbi:MAG: hypothetical protein E3K37_05050 [Candidatus Kuenenia sp.]|nr:hypothetical protein [Candidatus Kuenenia hertensis]